MKTIATTQAPAPTTPPRMPIGHVLKCWPVQFGQILVGEKVFETRRDDRGFATGDIIVLVEYDPETKQHTGRNITREIGFLDRSECMPKGFCTFQLQYSGAEMPMQARDTAKQARY